MPKTYPISIAAGRIAPQPVRFFVGLPSRYNGAKLLIIDVAKFDPAWAQNTQDYIGRDGVGSNQRHKYGNFKRFVIDRLNDCEKGYRYIKASDVDVLSDGRVGFTNGRHRYAVMRDAGVKRIPVAMTDKSTRNAIQYSYLA